MVINTSGNVGFGTNTPSVKLHVIGGDIAFPYGSGIRVSPEVTGWLNGTTKLIETGWNINGFSGDIVSIYTPGSASSSTKINLTSSGIINLNGYVGVGVTNPSYPLTVNSTTTATGFSYAYLTISGGVVNTGTSTANGTQAFSGYFASRVAATEFSAFSDSRIKNNIIDIDDVSALNVLRQIQPKRYNYVDIVKRGNVPVWGFIAQQVDSVLDYSVKQIIEFIPNIYQKCTISENGDGSTLLTVETPITFDSNGTGKIKLYDMNDKMQVVTIKSKINNLSFTINEQLGDSVYFVYGEEVDNFNTLDKNAIYTITTAAVQEIDSELQQTKAELQQTKAELQQTKDTIANLIQRIQALENK